MVYGWCYVNSDTKGKDNVWCLGGVSSGKGLSMGCGKDWIRFGLWLWL